MFTHFLMRRGQLLLLIVAPSNEDAATQARTAMLKDGGLKYEYALKRIINSGIPSPTPTKDTHKEFRGQVEMEIRELTLQKALKKVEECFREYHPAGYGTRITHIFRLKNCWKVCLNRLSSCD